MLKDFFGSLFCFGIIRPMTLKSIYEFVSKHDLAVVSTVSSNYSPESAVVEFAEYEDLTIIIDTLSTSRKYANLQANKEVAIVVGWDDDITVQINAQAHELKDEGLRKAKAVYFAKNERAKKWESRPDIAYFALEPTWIKYSDVSKTPWLIQEFHL